MAQQIIKKQMNRDSLNDKFTVGVAMSGGVDSSVTANLLKNKGHDVHGFFMALAQPDLDLQVERVQKVARYLEIPLTVVDLTAAFKKTVLDYFTQSYFKGKTPNPCIVCNPRIKFGLLLEAIHAAGCQRMATGHYARVVQDKDKTFHLLKGRDPKKDQSYFLHRLSQEQLAGILMPLGEQTKENVYKMAADLGLADLHGSESQDVCFLKDTDVSSFLARTSPAGKPDGPVVTMDGRVVGHHAGIHCFTVGQRKGLGIPDATPYYVLALDPLHNRVIVGKKDDLWQRELSVGNINWIAGKEPDLPRDFFTKIRYRHDGAPAEILKPEHEVYPVRFQAPQLAVTPGQFAVFYKDDEVIGGGEII